MMLLISEKTLSAVLAVSLCLLLATPCFAAKERGGDIELLRRTEILSYIGDPDLLKADLIGYFRRVAKVKLHDPEIESKLNLMLDGEAIFDDIVQSQYLPSENCTSEGGTLRSASTLNDTRRASICFSLTKLAALGTSRSEMMGLAAHEHARHFGIYGTAPGNTHELGDFVRRTFKLYRSNISKLNAIFPAYDWDETIADAVSLKFKIQSNDSECRTWANALGRDVDIVYTKRLSASVETLEIPMLQRPEAAQCGYSVNIYDSAGILVESLTPKDVRILDYFDGPLKATFFKKRDDETLFAPRFDDN